VKEKEIERWRVLCESSRQGRRWKHEVSRQWEWYHHRPGVRLHCPLCILMYVDLPSQLRHLVIPKKVPYLSTKTKCQLDIYTTVWLLWCVLALQIFSLKDYGVKMYVQDQKALASWPSLPTVHEWKALALVGIFLLHVTHGFFVPPKTQSWQFPFECLKKR